MSIIGDFWNTAKGGGEEAWKATGRKAWDAMNDIEIQRFLNDPIGYVKSKIKAGIKESWKDAVGMGMGKLLDTVKKHGGLKDLVNQVESIASVVDEYAEKLLDFAECAPWFENPAFHGLTTLIYAARLKGWVKTEAEAEIFGKSAEVASALGVSAPASGMIQCAIKVAFALPLKTAVDANPARGAPRVGKPEFIRCTAVWEPIPEGEGQAYGLTYPQMNALYAEQWKNNWRLRLLSAYMFQGKLMYAGVWKQSSAGQRVLWGAPYAEYRSLYDKIWGEGWRLRQLSPYILDGKLHFAAVWDPGSGAEYQEYQIAYKALDAKYGELWSKGMRLDLLSAYSFDGQVFYSAVWKPSTAGQRIYYGIPSQQFGKVYEEMWGQGWRLKTLSPYAHKGQLFYAALFKPATHGQIVAWDGSYGDITTKYNQLWSQGMRLSALSPFVT